jgi:hypothetical protein
MAVARPFSLQAVQGAIVVEMPFLPVDCLLPIPSAAVMASLGKAWQCGPCMASCFSEADEFEDGFGLPTFAGDLLEILVLVLPMLRCFGLQRCVPLEVNSNPWHIVVMAYRSDLQALLGLRQAPTADNFYLA